MTIGVVAIAELAIGESGGAEVYPDATALSIASSAPTIATGARVDVPAAALSIASSSPTIAAGARIDVPAAALSISAPTPAIPIVDLTHGDIVYACIIEAGSRGWEFDDEEPAIGEEEIAYVSDISRVYTSDPGYFATRAFATGDDDTPANVIFNGVLSAISLRRSINSGARFGGVAQGDGDLSIDNADGRFDSRMFQAIGGATVTLKAGRVGTRVVDWMTIMIGTARDQSFTDEMLHVQIRDDSYRLAVPIQTSLYLGTGGKEGGDDLVNKPKPLLLGYALNLSPPQVDPATLTYQIHDGALNAVFAVRDRGASLSFGEDHADYAALVGATIAGGEYDTCLAEGFIRLGGSPSGTVTADAATYRSSGKSKLSTIVRGVLDDYGSITSFDESSFTAMATAYPNDHGIWLSENSDALIDEALIDLIEGVAGFISFRRDGRCLFGRVTVSASAPALRAFGMRDILDFENARLPSDLSPPPWRLRLRYAFNHTAQTDLAGSADQVWAQPGKVAVAQDSNVQLDYDLAQDPPPLDTSFVDASDAESEATRQLAIWKEQRPLRRLTLPRSAITTEIGDVVDVAYDRLGGQRRGVNIEDNIEVGDDLDTVELMVYG